MTEKEIVWGRDRITFYMHFVSIGSMKKQILKMNCAHVSALMS